MTKLTRSGLVYGVMNANATLPMDEVLQLIVDADKVSGLPGKTVDLKRAKAYYTHAVKNGLANGIGATKTVRAAKAPKAPKAPKLIKPKNDMSFTKDRKPVKDKTVEELADIRAKNLARLKAVGRKYAKGQYAEPRVSDEPFDENAVPNLEAELDSFKAPKFLSMDQVKALV
jgi:hypothetical protein